VTLHSFAINEGDVNPGLLGFVIVALLGGANWLLVRSMHRQLKKIDFEEQGPGPPERTGPTEGAGPAEPQERP
jgi:hypothetical protein